MNAEQLLQHFERISEAPDAIPRLRSFILDLAVRGKLVEQVPSDESAAELLKRIAAEKARLVKAGEIKKPKRLQELGEVPFGLPTNWLWTRIREVTTDRGHETPQSKFTYIDVTAIDKEAGIVAEARTLEATEAPSRARKKTKKGDVIYSCVRPYLLNVAIIDRDFEPEPIASTAFAILNGYGLILPRYLWIVLRSPFMVKCVEETQRGQAYPAINDADFAVLPFPLPPLSEQHRIVAKVEELMSLCDQLEEAKAEREQSRDSLVAASLHRLNQPAEEEETFHEDVRFTFNNLQRITTRAAHIKQLRQTILNLAVRGKLVEQDPSDEPAAELLKRIADGKTERKARTGDARIKPEKDPFPEDLPLLLPDGWATQSFQNLFLFIDYRGKTPPKTAEGIPLITAKNIRMGFLNRDPREYISAETFKSWMTRGFPENGDLFFTTEAPLANVCLNDIKEPFALAQRAICFRPYAKIDTKFIMFALMSDIMQSLIDAHATGMTAKGIKAAKLKPLPIPIPPLAEQHRIVAKVHELMAMCDQLEAQITVTEQDSRRFLESVLAEALAPDSDLRTVAEVA